MKINPIEVVPISQIQGNKSNPRYIKEKEFKELVESVRKFPKMMEARPIIVDENDIILGGNMRYKAALELGYKEVHIVRITDATEEQKREFIIKDNVSKGEWDWDILANDWNAEQLEDWGLNIGGFDVDADKLGEEFDLPNGDKSPFQQITFTLADEQAEQIKNALADIKQTEEFKYAETMGNENSNGNALYLIIMQWMQTRN